MSLFGNPRSNAHKVPPRVLVVGGPPLVRHHVMETLQAGTCVVTGVDEPQQAAALLADAIHGEGALPVLVVPCTTLAEGVGRLAVVRKEHTGAPALVLVENVEPLPKALDGLPEMVVRGRFEKADVAHRVLTLWALSNARAQAARATHEALEARLTMDRLKRALETERTTVKHVTRYVSGAVLEQLASGTLTMPPTRKQLSVLFSDIRGFTDASGFSSPEDLVDLLNDYLPEVNRVVTAHGGNLDKFMGDGILAYFVQTPLQPDHSLRAVQAAFRLLERVEELKVSWFERGFLPVGVGVGVTSGGAVMGTIGTGERLDHTIIGPTVNLAARLQGLARGGEVAMDEPTYEAVRPLVGARLGQQVNVKGFEAPITVYTVAAHGRVA